MTKNGSQSAFREASERGLEPEKGHDTGPPSGVVTFEARVPLRIKDPWKTGYKTERIGG